ncbi:MAG: NAD(P)H-dependent oxidoreductase [Oscillospiraceae bacterium]|jgi:flavodoxin|nr:NAD(P)H-dependent oxidoreductase [Oscillospiraceae bacterium]
MNLVAYFSASGVTAKVAKTLAEALDAREFEIRPATPYTQADLDWTDKNSRSTLEMNNPASRPAIAETCPQIAESDVIFLGFPIWWYVAPRIINTFLESYDFSGKTIVPFATSGSSGMGDTVKHLLPSVSDSATVKPGKLLYAAQTKQSLEAWLAELGLV